MDRQAIWTGRRVFCASIWCLLSSAVCAQELPQEPKISAAVTDAHAKEMAAGLEVFKRHVRPILIEQCVRCHGGEATEAEFDITSRELLLKGGSSGAAVKPGDPEGSLLYQLVTHQQEPTMPQEVSKLPAAQIERIADWIKLGAPYDGALLEKETATSWTEKKIDSSSKEFWAFKPLKPAEPPAAADAWCQTPIDQFVLARLAAAELRPNEPAQKRTLLRRLYLDLIGLPPTAEEVEQFVADPAADAYERVVDKLLASPHFGERWARHWLDVARFAESHGFEQDYDRPYAYHYRDFVIKAFNSDLPYDDFVRWQIAGDELKPDEPLAMMATGFLGAGVFPTQITANEVEKSRYDALDDMAATTGTAFLGLTVGCARCHDHKFDPIPQADYYRLLSTFTTTVRSEVELNLEPHAYQQAKRQFDAEHAPLVEDLARYERDHLTGQFEAWENAQAQPDPGWLVLDDAVFSSAGGATFAKQPDGSFLATGTNAASDTYTVKATPPPGQITAVRIEALAHKGLVADGPGRATNGNFDLTDVQLSVSRPSGGEPINGRFADARATFEQKGLPVKAAIDDQPKSGWAVDPQFGKDHAAVFELAEPIAVAEGAELTLTLKFDGNTGHNIARPRVSLSRGPLPAPLAGPTMLQSVQVALDTPREQRTAEQQSALLGWYGPNDPKWVELHARVEAHAAQEPQPKLAKVMVTSEGVKPIRHHTQGADFFEETYFLTRGDLEHKQGVATQGFLQVLMNAPEDERHWQVEPPEGARTSYRRTALANWLTDTDEGAGNLLARVIVNRLWQHHLGRGIVGTPSDFGTQGQPPTHPELLDWLAAELIRGGWKLKPIHKLIVMSSVYRQSSDFDGVDAKEDPSNLLYWRFGPRRLEAEIVRDSMLAASGVLDPAMYGAGTLDPNHRRRSIYFMIKRSKLIPMMTLFDAPEPLVSIGQRASTTIAPQALALMNSPQVCSYAEALAAKADASANGPLEQTIRQAYLITLGRAPDDHEQSAATAFIEQQMQSYKSTGAAGARKLAVTDFCQALFGLNEFIYIQ